MTMKKMIVSCLVACSLMSTANSKIEMEHLEFLEKLAENSAQLLTYKEKFEEAGKKILEKELKEQKKELSEKAFEQLVSEVSKKMYEEKIVLVEKMKETYGELYNTNANFRALAEAQKAQRLLEDNIDMAVSIPDGFSATELLLYSNEIKGHLDQADRRLNIALADKDFHVDTTVEQMFKGALESAQRYQGIFVDASSLFRKKMEVSIDGDKMSLYAFMIADDGNCGKYSLGTTTNGMVKTFVKYDRHDKVHEYVSEKVNAGSLDQPFMQAAKNGDFDNIFEIDLSGYSTAHFAAIKKILSPLAQISEEIESAKQEINELNNPFNFSQFNEFEFNDGFEEENEAIKLSLVLDLENKQKQLEEKLSSEKIRVRNVMLSYLQKFPDVLNVILGYYFDGLWTSVAENKLYSELVERNYIQLDPAGENLIYDEKDSLPWNSKKKSNFVVSSMDQDVRHYTVLVSSDDRARMLKAYRHEARVLNSYREKFNILISWKGAYDYYLKHYFLDNLAQQQKLN